MDYELLYINYLAYNKNIMLEYSYIEPSNTELKQPDEGLGIYTGYIHPSWKNNYIKPNAFEYTQQFYATKHIPGYTRIGNNTLHC